MQIAKQCFFLLALATAALFMPHAKAACTSPDMPKMINVSSISVSTTLPVGETIPGTEQTVHVAGNCDESVESGLEIVSCYYGSGAEISGLPGVYDSGVPGIGVALMNDQGQRIRGAGGVQCDSRNSPIGYVSTDGKQSFNFNVTLELVKTSDSVASGTLVQAQTRFGIGVFAHDGIGNPNTIAYSGNVILHQVTCSVSPKNLTVNLGDFPLSDFVGTGTLSTPAQKVYIDVYCDTNIEPEFKVSSGNGYESAFPGVIKLTQQSDMATGVGVQILLDGMLPTFDEYMTVGSEIYANQTFRMPVDMRYEQTSAVVTPGAANSVATITLAYK